MSRADHYAARVDAFITPHVERARAGASHPVWDFLFSYYSLRPRQLRCWHPGYGVRLAGAEAFRRYRDRRGYGGDADGVTVSKDHLRSRLDTIAFVADLLARHRAAAAPAELLRVARVGDGLPQRRPSATTVFRCDWARPAPTRWSRPSSRAPLRCSHFDAYRFFTADAAPRNTGSPSRATQQDWEQPGCLHANMDLYKWSYKLSPLIDSELLLDCLELAAAAREIDMRASPYDLSDYGYTPIAVEDAAGRAEYVRCQKAIAARAAPLRAALLDRCDLLLRAAGCQ